MMEYYKKYRNSMYRALKTLDRNSSEFDNAMDVIHGAVRVKARTMKLHGLIFKVRDRETDEWKDTKLIPQLRKGKTIYMTTMG